MHENSLNFSIGGSLWFDAYKSIDEKGHSNSTTEQKRWNWGKTIGIFYI